MLSNSFFDSHSHDLILYGLHLRVLNLYPNLSYMRSFAVRAIISAKIQKFVANGLVTNLVRMFHGIIIIKKSSVFLANTVYHIPISHENYSRNFYRKDDSSID